ncbi:protein GPR107 isoform X1 [Diaphorina citri]|uniref:Protein GPR107 isoform X1 n=2 Tax=Diaphorina citri TaxID=121845 RepID=A0A3Q0IMY4_DIACI|nr:protein GPR107 isoform X1 [Diaphorina citri]KAI5730604.1 hypothetical protein M8J76_015604 [Diaphorina citri]
MSPVFLSVLLVALLSSYTQARIHKLTINNDDRKYIALSTFGFYKGGILNINLINFESFPSAQENYTFGFSLDRTMSDAMNPYLDTHQDQCLLEESSLKSSLVYFIMDIKNKMLKVKCGSDMSNLHIYRDMSKLPPVRTKRSSIMGDQALFANRRILFVSNGPKEAGVPGSAVVNGAGSEVPSGTGVLAGGVNGLGENDVLPTCTSIQLPLVFNQKGQINASFVIFIASEAEEGLYNLYLHNCQNYHQPYGSEGVRVNFTIHIEERNVENFLSAGEMPLPALYLTLSLLFCLSGSFWFMILQKSSHPVYKIHYLMAVLVYIKSLALLFHSINFHFLQTKGEHVAAWAILYYITHVLRGSVLFITMALIGTGWTFIKHILSSREKKVFMIVIPLQVLSNVAQIIIEESEEGDIEHLTWLKVFMLVDLLCCGLILFPVVWSIRHLQEASHTDGKAAMNLRKLKLFRHFYVMIVVYIYFTRIIVYLIRMTIPFQYEWLDEMFKEMATYVFFVLTAYKFRPTSTNPYFQLNMADIEDDEDVDIVISECPMTEGISKLTRINQKERDGEDEDDRETTTMLQKRESSHEYD